jgi:hypothetical protein
MIISPWNRKGMNMNAKMAGVRSNGRDTISLKDDMTCHTSDE